MNIFKAIGLYFKGWAMPSADGKGRTLFDIFLGRNKRPFGPVEFQYHNPFGAKVGNSVNFAHDLRLSGINFFIESIHVDKTVMESGKTFVDTEYVLKGQSLTMDKPLRGRLRVTPWDDAPDPKFPFKVLWLEQYDQMEWDQGFYDYVSNPNGGVFEVQQDDEGNQLAESRKYWRVDDAKIAYNIERTTMKDLNRDGTVQHDELTHSKVAFWDYSRMTPLQEGDSTMVEEFLNVEMDKDTRYFFLFRGKEVKPFQVTVI